MPNSLLPKTTWVEIRRLYEQGGKSAPDLAAAFSISRPSITKRIQREGWKVGALPPEADPALDPIREGVKSNLIDLATGKAIDVLARSGGLDELGRSSAQSMLVQARLNTKFEEMADRELAFSKKLAEDPKTDPLLRLAAARTAARITKDAIGTSRTVSGLKPGQGSLDMTGGINPTAPAGTAPATAPTDDELEEKPPAILTPGLRIAFYSVPKPEPPPAEATG
jgi:hypothetical protein